jgi:DNA-binding response OmpR family regulator
MRKILIVEDEELIREMYDLALSTQPFQVELAENGQIALEKCQNTEFDLILLDLMMPVLDGIGFLRKFLPTAPPNTRLIVMSNLSSGNEFDIATALGVHRTALKANISPRELVAMVRYELEAI